MDTPHVHRVNGDHALSGCCGLQRKSKLHGAVANLDIRGKEFVEIGLSIGLHSQRAGQDAALTFMNCLKERRERHRRLQELYSKRMG